MISEGVGARTLWAREESAEISRSCGGRRRLGRWGHRHRAGLGSWTDTAHATPGDIHLHPEIGEDPPVPRPSGGEVHGWQSAALLTRTSAEGTVMSRTRPHRERSEVLSLPGGCVRRSRSGHGADLFWGSWCWRAGCLAHLFAPHMPLSARHCLLRPRPQPLVRISGQDPGPGSVWE